MDQIFEAYDTKKVRTIKGDFIDRLHSQYTVTLLFVICILVGLRQYDDGTIVCWLPGYFSGDQGDYAHELCWVNNTYYYPSVSDADMFPESLKHVIPYYQFILFILFGQAMLFYAPSFIWNTLVSDSAGYIKKVLDQVERADLVKKSIETFKGELISNGASRKAKFRRNRDKFEKSGPVDEIVIEEEVIDQDKIDDVNAQSTHLLSKEFTDSVKSTVNFVRTGSIRPLFERKRDIKEAQNNNNKQLRGSISSEQSTDPSQKYGLTKLVEVKEDPSRSRHLQDQRVLHFDERPPSQHQQHNSFTQSVRARAKHRIISFMKPVRGVQHLAAQYMFLKFLNLGNVITQISLLHWIFGAEFYQYGYDFMFRVVVDRDPFTLARQFPLITFCDFYVHQNLRQIYWHSTQCILSINVYIEKFYVIIWFWMFFLLIATIFNIGSWIHEIYISEKYLFIKKYIEIKERMLKQDFNERQRLRGNTSKHVPVKDHELALLDDNEVQLFQKKYLGNDGFVMLHMIKNVVGDIMFIELLHELWIDFKRTLA